ncbi:hypothetical protein Dimus_036748 [Dionaea muscipula]
MEVDAELVAKIPSSFMAELRIIEYKEEVEHDEDPRSVAGQDPPEHHNELKKNQAMEVSSLFGSFRLDSPFLSGLDCCIEDLSLQLRSVIVGFGWG